MFVRSSWFIVLFTSPISMLIFCLVVLLKAEYSDFQLLLLNCLFLLSVPSVLLHVFWSSMERCICIFIIVVSSWWIDTDIITKSSKLPQSGEEENENGAPWSYWELVFCFLFFFKHSSNYCEPLVRVWRKFTVTFYRGSSEALIPPF